MQGQSYYNQTYSKSFSVFRTAPNLFIARVSDRWLGSDEKKFRTFALAKAYIKQKEREARK